MPITPGAFGGQLPYIEPIPWPSFSAEAVYFTANFAVLVAVRVAAPVVISTIEYYVGTASGNVDVGIYTYDGSTFTRAASSGSTAASGTNAIQAINLTAPYALAPGVTYYFAIAADNITITMTRIVPHSATTLAHARAVAKSSSFPLPATITTPVGTSYVPFLAGS